MKELLKIIEQNPDIPVKFSCAYDVVKDDHGWWLCNIEDIKIVDNLIIDEEIEDRTFIDKEDYLDYIEDDLEFSKEEANDRYLKNTKGKHILVYLGEYKA